MEQKPRNLKAVKAAGVTSFFGQSCSYANFKVLQVAVGALQFITF